MREWFREYFGLQYIIGDNTNAFNFNGLGKKVEHEVDEIIRYGELKGDKNKRILDIACSYGKHMIELAAQINCEIYGLDINNELIDIAIYRKDRGLNVYEQPVKLKSKVNFMVGDMRNFSDILNGFDLIYNWSWSFGCFSHKENMKTLQEFYNCLKKNGILLIHTIPIENVPKYLEDYKRETLPVKIAGKNYPKGILHFTKIFDRENKILHTIWTVMLENGMVLPKQPAVSSVLMYSTNEYVKMLKETGFKKIEVHKSYFPLKIFKARK